MLKNDELNELKGHFLASLNHEIRTPLSGILGMTDLLLETALTEDQREYVDATRGCAENLLEILNVTLEFSALSANHIRPDESEFSVRETLQSVAAEFDAKARAKGLRLTCNFDRNVPDAVIGDGLRLRQMLRHLVSNAVKFTNQGEIEIGARAGNAIESSVPLTFTVRDTGIGIPPDQLTSIFEGFRQLETGLGRAYSGLGLGLAVTQKLASLLQGSITVESEVGRGSKFVVRLPLRVPADAVLRQEAAKFRGRILVADDNAIAQTIARHTLRRQDYEVACVGDGPSAIEAARRERFDLILMDLQMPGLDGFQTAESIRKLDGYDETPIIAVTANCSPDYRERALKYGMQDFLSKPVATVDLIETVEKYLHPASLPL